MIGFVGGADLLRVWMMYDYRYIVLLFQGMIIGI